MIKEHFQIENLHHAYLIEGEKEIILSQIFDFLKKEGISTKGNPDLYNIELDSFKIEDALNLRDMVFKRSFNGGKKFFIFSVDNFTNEAQAVLLKIIEDPLPHTHFFISMPDTSSVLPTLFSRLYFISTNLNFTNEEKKIVKEFLKMTKPKRIEFLKQFLKERSQDALNGSVKAKAHKFLNILEEILYKDFGKNDTNIFEHIFNVRLYLRQNGSSPKNMLESLALLIPVI